MFGRMLLFICLIPTAAFAGEAAKFETKVEFEIESPVPRPTIVECGRSAEHIRGGAIISRCYNSAETCKSQAEKAKKDPTSILDFGYFLESEKVVFFSRYECGDCLNSTEQKSEKCKARYTRHLENGELERSPRMRGARHDIVQAVGMWLQGQPVPESPHYAQSISGWEVSFPECREKTTEIPIDPEGFYLYPITHYCFDIVAPVELHLTCKKPNACE